MAGAKPTRFLYNPKRALLETEDMPAPEELAFRRTVDMIVVYRNHLVDDDAELARTTKAGDAWPQIKARLVRNRMLYIEDGYIRNARYTEICTAVEQSTRQRSQAGRVSAARRARKTTEPGPPPMPEKVTPIEAPPQQPLTLQPLPDPPAIGVEVPAPVVPVNGGGAVDGTMRAEQEGMRIPQDWQPKPEGVAFAVARGYAEPQIEALVVGYVTNCHDKGIVSKDPDAGFKMWVLRSINSRPSPGVGKPMATAL